MGKTFYNWLILPNDDQVKLIDFENINNNDFAIVDEFPFSIKEKTELGSFRPDITILINGMPLSFLEVKKPNNPGGIQVEFERMINDRLANEDYKKFFNLIQIVSFSNNMNYEEADDDIAEDVKAGSFYTTPNGYETSFSFFREDIKKYHENYELIDVDEKTVKYITKDCGYNPEETETVEFQTNLSPMTPCNAFITSFYDKERVLFMLNYGLMYLSRKKEVKNQTTNKVEEIPIHQKHIMRYPQFFATRAIIGRLEAGGRRGVIWHTQGSGKTALSAYSYRILSDYYSKKGINTRFFFVVDRLDLMRQATDEFTDRGFSVINCSNKEELARELNSPLSSDTKGLGVIVVVNIHKIMEKSEMPEVHNDYNVPVQRIFFVDEAHRSYNKHGEFYKNLMTCDDDALYFALTGTPILRAAEKSNLKFGDYIHKYFYDKSIADGYTLRIKKECINTTARTEIRENLEIEDQDINSADVYESDAYIDAVSKYIEKDFRQFRLVNSDNTIGGMIVCRSNKQAKLIHDWFSQHGQLTTGLVMSDSENNVVQNLLNKQNQTNFRENGYPDILVVHYMLTTGYDVKRLKKMYLLRGPRAQSLLQTISRVNRPYKSPNGKIYKYGYIVDFVDIEKEYTETLDAYIKELEFDLNGETGENNSLSGLIIDKEDIKRKFDKLVSEIKLFIHEDNIEKFSQYMEYLNKEALIKIRKLLRNVKDCSIEFKLSRAIEYSSLIDDDRVNKYIRVLEDRISFINLSSQAINTLDIMNNEEVVKVIYEFIKIKIVILNLADFSITDEDLAKIKGTVEKVQNEIRRNKNRKDIRVNKLEELLQEIFQKLQMFQYESIDELDEELRRAYEEAKKINDENDRLSAEYGGSYAFVKTLTDAVVETEVDRSDIEKLLKIVYEDVKDKLNDEALVLQGQKGFVDTVKSHITKILVREKLYSKVKVIYNDVLSNLYINILLLKEAL